MNTKRGISLLLAVVLVCAMLPTGELKVNAADNYDTVYHPVDGGVLQFNMLTGEIEKFTPANDTEEVSIVIPSEIEGVAVTAITYNRADGAEGYQADSGAFENCENVVNVTLPETLSYIGFGAFAESGITQVTIPESVTRLDPYSFFGSKLQSVEIYGKVELRGANFAECYDLREVKFLGDAPEFWSGDGWHVFGPMLEADENMNVTIYYPAENTTWTEGIMQNYGGTLTWVAFTDYEVMDGGDAVLHKDNNQPHSIRVAGAIDKFLNVSLNGILVDPVNYTVTEGSTVITFQKEFLDMLEPGSYAVQINFVDGVAETSMTIEGTQAQPQQPNQPTEPQQSQQSTQPSESSQPQRPTESNNPQTGSRTTVVPMAILLILSLAGVVISAFGKKRSGYSKG